MDFLTSSPSTGPHHINSEGSARVRDSLKEWRGSGGWPEENRGSEAFQHEQKRKRKEDKDAAQRTPRRMASLRAAEQVMAISKAGPARGSETTSSSQTSNSLGATSSAASSSSSPPRTSPLANVRTKRLRTQSTSPLPPPQQSTQPLTRPETNGAISGVPTSSHAQSEVEDKAVMWERRPLPSIPSSSKTDILLRPPPTLPYDSSYPPLSPNGVDQIGHPLPPPLNAPSELGKGGLDLSKQGRAGAGSGKRAIPGQELEEHLVSEIPGQKAMPWGLQKTLLQKQKGRRAGRTKMGTARRTALRESRRGKGRVGVGMGDGWGGSGSGTTEIELPKVEDDVMSETESPITAVVDPAALASHPDLPRSRLSTPVKGKQPAANSNMRRMTAAPHATTASPNKLMYASGEAVTKTDANDGVGNNEYCETCGGVGHFICCDGCPRSFHFACINPPLDINELPSVIGDASDTWYCNACRAVQKPNKGKASKSGIFGSMLQQLGEENPSIFALPADIRNYFKGVATGNDGSYVDSSMLRPIKVNKFGILDEREPLRLKDKNGKPILCYRCGESAMPTDPLPAILPATTSTSTPASSPAAKDRAGGRPSRAAAQIAHAALTPNQQSKAAEAEETASSDARRAWRKIISCDFCSLHWHLDCLDPPLANMPSLGRKWMCPNHVEHVIPSERIPKSVANSTSIHDLPLPSKETIGPGKHYRMRVVNDGRIDIIPDPMDTYTGPSHDNPEVLGSIGSSNGNSASGKANGISSEKGNKEEAATTSVLPAYKVYPTVFGRHNNIKFRYRLPEKVVRLDFWTKAELLREQMADAALKHTHKVRRHGLDMLALVANAASYDSAENKGEMSREEDQSPMSVSAAKELVERILPDANDSNVNHPYVQPGEEPVSTLRQSFIPGEYEREFEHVTDDSTVPNVKLESMSSSELPHAPASTALDEAEVAKLQAIRQLLEYKGEGALLRFLLE